MQLAAPRVKGTLDNVQAAKPPQLMRAARWDSWSLSDRLQMLAFEAELAHLPRSLIAAIWEALDRLDSLDSQIEPGRDLRSRSS